MRKTTKLAAGQPYPGMTGPRKMVKHRPCMNSASSTSLRREGATWSKQFFGSARARDSVHGKARLRPRNWPLSSHRHKRKTLIGRSNAGSLNIPARRRKTMRTKRRSARLLLVIQGNSRSIPPFAIWVQPCLGEGAHGRSHMMVGVVMERHHNVVHLARLQVDKIVIGHVIAPGFVRSQVRITARSQIHHINHTD